MTFDVFSFLFIFHTTGINYELFLTENPFFVFLVFSRKAVCNSILVLASIVAGHEDNAEHADC